MTIFKNLHHIDVLKKTQKRDLLLHSRIERCECNKSFWRSFFFFSNNQEVKQCLMLPCGSHIKNNETESKDLFSNKVKSISLFCSFSMIRFSSQSEAFLGKMKKDALLAFKESTDSKPFKKFRGILKKKRRGRESCKRMLDRINKTKPIPCTREDSQAVFANARDAYRSPIFTIKDAIESRNKYGYRVQVKKVKKSRRLAPDSLFSLQERGALPRKKLVTSKQKKKKNSFFRIKKSASLFTAGKRRLVRIKQDIFDRKTEYKKYKKKRWKPKQKTPIIIPRGAKIGKILIRGSYNNIILTLMDQEGNTKAWASAGTAGFKNGRKSSDFAAESAADRLADRSIALGYTFARVTIKGLGSGKMKAIRRLCKSSLKLLGVGSSFSIAYNGCRRARKPRK